MSGVIFTANRLHLSEIAARAKSGCRYAQFPTPPAVSPRRSAIISTIAEGIIGQCETDCVLLEGNCRAFGGGNRIPTPTHVDEWKTWDAVRRGGGPAGGSRCFPPESRIANLYTGPDGLRAHGPQR